MRDYKETTNYKTQMLLRRLEKANENDKPKIILAINLLTLRAESKKGQTEIANSLNIDQKNYGQWERGEIAPSLRYLIAIAKFYGVTIDRLLSLNF